MGVLWQSTSETRAGTKCFGQLGPQLSLHCSKLQCTVKTTKGPRRVTHRNLHTAPASKFEALAEYREFALHLAGLSSGSRGYLVRIDVCGFFMSSNPEELIDNATAIVDDEQLERRLLEGALHVAFSVQWAFSDLLGQDLYKVVQGSGMRLRRSSSIVDAAFCNRQRRASRSQSLRWIQLKPTKGSGTICG